MHLKIALKLCHRADETFLYMISNSLLKGLGRGCVLDESHRGKPMNEEVVLPMVGRGLLLSFREHDKLKIN